jgi:preprotein translocase subunit YajC
MCKAVAETSIAGGNSQGAGLNAGILYIMVFPYILIGVCFFFWYRHRKQMQSEQES